MDFYFLVLMVVTIVFLVSDIILSVKNDILKSEISNIKILQNTLNNDSKNLETYTKDLVSSFNRIRQKDKENVNNLIADLKNLEQKRYDCINEKIRVRTIKLQNIELRLKAFESMTIDRFKNISEQINGTIDIEINKLPKGKKITGKDIHGNIVTVARLKKRPVYGILKMKNGSKIRFKK